MNDRVVYVCMSNARETNRGKAPQFQFVLSALSDDFANYHLM